jgi:hypothetical protein
VLLTGKYLFIAIVAGVASVIAVLVLANEWPNYLYFDRAMYFDSEHWLSYASHCLVIVVIGCYHYFDEVDSRL